MQRPFESVDEMGHLEHGIRDRGRIRRIRVEAPVALAVRVQPRFRPAPNFIRAPAAPPASAQDGSDPRR